MSYTFKKILNSESIGDTLSTVNLNYSNLSNWVIDFQTNYSNLWKPLFDYYNSNSDIFNQTVSLTQTYSSDWDSYQTTVQANSSKWLQPFTIFYPNILQDPFDEINYLSIITDWLSTNFPVKNSDNTSNYVENQQAIISCYTFLTSAKIDLYKDMVDYTDCNTKNGRACARCETIITGNPVYCFEGTFDCNYSSVIRNCNKSNCYYTFPPYYPLDSNKNQNTLLSSATARSKIEAQINMNFTDRWEAPNITTISFKVVDCDWFFDKFITA